MILEPARSRAFDFFFSFLSTVNQRLLPEIARHEVEIIRGTLYAQLGLMISTNRLLSPHPREEKPFHGFPVPPCPVLSYSSMTPTGTNRGCRARSPDEPLAARRTHGKGFFTLSRT